MGKPIRDFLRVVAAAVFVFGVFVFGVFLGVVGYIAIIYIYFIIHFVAEFSRP
jgi:uncharacterized BrkB/YihY/UPF0761 family membrane protein